MSNNWQIKKLGEVCEINLGKTPARGNNKFWDKGKSSKNIWLSISDLKNTEMGYIFDSKEYISDMAIEYTGIRPVLAGTLLLSFKLTIGRTGFAGTGLYTNEAIAALPIKSNFSRKLSLCFLKYYFSFFDWDRYAEKDEKVKGKTLNKAKLKQIPIPVPPLAEQERIVGVLDEAFAKIEQLQANAESNLQNAKTLFKQMLEQEITPRKEWKISYLKELCSKIGSGATPKGGRESYQSTGVSLIRSMNVQYGEFKYRELAHISNDQAKKLDNVAINRDDILLNITGASIARCCKVPSDIIPARVNQHVSIIRLSSCEISHDYLVYFLISPQIQKKLLKIGGAGSTREALTKNQLEHFTIEYPVKLKEQESIVSRLDKVATYCRTLEDNYKKILEDCAELKTVILNKAFKGEL